MNLAAILSTRSYLKDPFYHLVYEWEDDLGAQLSVPVLNSIPAFRKLLINKITRKALSFLGENALAKASNAVERANIFRPSKGYYLVFEMGVTMAPNFSTSTKAIPAFIDLWKQTDLKAFQHTYRHCPLVLVSSLEAVEYLKAQNCQLPITHFPLSLSDRYQAKPGVVYDKEYDIILAGRTNPVLLEYLQTFSEKYPDVEIVRQKEIDGEFCYASNLRGKIGLFQTREEYVQLLRAGKISFYSTPGIDGGEKRTGGFNPVTPRYLELLSAQCLLLGKYPDNAETRFYELEKVCPNIDSYTQFEELLLHYLKQQSVPLELYEKILQKHYTSCRAMQIQELVSSLK